VKCPAHGMHGILAHMDNRDARYHGGANLPPSGMAPAVHAAIAAHYALSFEAILQLAGGEECEIWLVRSDQGQCVVRISPPWRSLTRLGWTHALLLALQPMLPVVIAPLRAPNGSTLLIYHEHPVALFPYVDGQPVDREDPAQREAAARVLAHLHRVMLRVSVPDAAPVRHLREAPLAPRIADPAALHDAELDTWHATLVQRRGTLTCGPIHGDYYRRNLLVSRGVITAVLDWDDAHPDFLMQEVAWAAWEFGKTAAGVNWHPERAHAFVETYRAAGGPCRADEYSTLLPFIRWRLREEVRYNLAAAAAGERWDPAYVDAEVQAFQQLHGHTFTI
jgi:Ser/Thr protein kinase RdoA (MazF antagonist)